MLAVARLGAQRVAVVHRVATVLALLAAKAALRQEGRWVAPAVTAATTAAVTPPPSEVAVATRAVLPPLAMLQTKGASVVAAAATRARWRI